MNFFQYLLAAMETAPSLEAEQAVEVTEAAAKMAFEPGRFLDMLSYMGIGMFIIFVLIGVIILVTVLVNKIFSGNQE